jgi:TonB family protein
MSVSRLDGRSPLGAGVVGLLCLFVPSGGRAAAAATPYLEPPITAAGAEGDYLRALHQRIHQHWAEGFVASSARALPAASPLNDPARQAVVLFSIRWDGTLAEVSLVGGSGVDSFDQAATEVVHQGGPFFPPPFEVLSDDGMAYFRWTLARDHRLCAGGELRRREDPVGESIPRLLGENRVREAVLRVAREMKSADTTDALTIFARTWLAKPIADPVADVGAAAALARTGDARQVFRLRRALDDRETVATAAAALGLLKIDVCSMVQGRLSDPDPAARALGVLAVRAAGQPAEPSSPCVEPLAAITLEAMLPGRLRAMAAEALAAASPERAGPVLAAAMRDDDVTLRAAAVLLSAQPGGGRPALYRLIALVHDAAIEVRAAAAAGMVRCCGDLALTELVLVFKEHDTRPAVAVAAELGRLSSAESAAYLGRIARRHEPEVRRAVLQALGTRQDAAARALQLRLSNAAGADAWGATAAWPAATATYQALLRGFHYPEAATWILAEVERLEPRAAVEVLVSWLERPSAPMPLPVSAR